MNTKILSISIPHEMNEFLLNNPDLSPSKAFQGKILEIQQTRKLYSDEIEQIRRANNLLQKRLLEATTFISKKNLWEEFQEDLKNVV